MTGTDTLSRILFMPDGARPLHADEAPVLPEQLDPALMPRMCPGLARVRLALYAAAKPMQIVKAPTGSQFYEIEAERKSEEYKAALAAYRRHMAECERCRSEFEEGSV